MKKWLKIGGGGLLGLIVLMLLFGKCESDIPKEKEVSVSNVDMTGYVTPYLKVVDGTYTFTQDRNGASISVKFELVQKPSEKFFDKTWAKIVLNPIGKNGTVYDLGWSKFSAEDEEIQKIKDLLNGNIGDVKNIVFSYRSYSNEEMIRSIFENAESFEIIDQAFTDENPTDSSNVFIDESTPESSINSYADDWDSILDEYEEFVDDYISALKKAANGDMSAMQHSSDLLEKAEALGNRLSNANANLNSAQRNRLLKIQNKMANAAMSM